MGNEINKEVYAAARREACENAKEDFFLAGITNTDEQVDKETERIYKREMEGK